MRNLVRVALRLLLGPSAAAHANGGLLPAGTRWYRLGSDEHVLRPTGGQLRCVRPGHQRHVCHGNQYDPDTLAWRNR